MRTCATKKINEHNFNKYEIMSGIWTTHYTSDGKPYMYNMRLKKSIWYTSSTASLSATNITEFRPSMPVSTPFSISSLLPANTIPVIQHTLPSSVVSANSAVSGSTHNTVSGPNYSNYTTDPQSSSLSALLSTSTTLSTMPSMSQKSLPTNLQSFDPI